MFNNKKQIVDRRRPVFNTLDHYGLLLNMWVKRTPKEEERWMVLTAREARNSALIFGGIIWIGMSIALAGCFDFRYGFASSYRDGFGTLGWRLFFASIPSFLFAYLAFRRERKKGFDCLLDMTICPTCDRASEGNANTSCDCGGTFVPQYTMKWIKEPKTPTGST